MTIVNFIKACPLNRHIFAQLCEDETHQTLLLHTEVRWLSHGKVLELFIELQSQIQEFLTLHNPKLLEEIANYFLIKTTYLRTFLHSIMTQTHAGCTDQYNAMQKEGGRICA